MATEGAQQRQVVGRDRPQSGEQDVQEQEEARGRRLSLPSGVVRVEDDQRNQVIAACCGSVVCCVSYCMKLDCTISQCELDCTMSYCMKLDCTMAQCSDVIVVQLDPRPTQQVLREWTAIDRAMVRRLAATLRKLHETVRSSYAPCSEITSRPPVRRSLGSPSLDPQ